MRDTRNGSRNSSFSSILITLLWLFMSSIVCALCERKQRVFHTHTKTYSPENLVPFPSCVYFPSKKRQVAACPLDTRRDTSCDWQSRQRQRDSTTCVMSEDRKNKYTVVPQQDEELEVLGSQGSHLLDQEPVKLPFLFLSSKLTRILL